MPLWRDLIRILSRCSARWPRAAAIACALVLGANASTAWAGTVVAGPSEALIVTRLSLVKDTDMDFGNIIRPAAAGTVVLNPTAAPSCTVTGGLIRFGPCQPATFYGFGTVNRIVGINKPNSPIVVSNGAQTMNITNVSINTGADLTYVSGNVNGNGVVRYRIAAPGGLFGFRLGGTLHVNANQAAGLYTATFQVSIQYQ
jgi:hypothetical protein